MQEALGNLISNAIKYSDNESEIIISVNQSNDENIIAVKDYGIGISEKHQERLAKLAGGVAVLYVGAA